MTTFYNLLDDIKEVLQDSPFVTTVTYGDLFSVDLKKQTIFPLSHFIVNNGEYQGSTWTFEVSLICMDLIDINKDNTDFFRGNDNTHDILNTQLQVISKVLGEVKKGTMRDRGYALIGNPTTEAFADRFENGLAGWTVTFNVQIINEYSIC